MVLRRKYNGAKTITEDVDLYFVQVVEERSHQRRSRTVRSGGAVGSENVGMSNVNSGENPGHQKPKGSHATVIDVGLVGPKA